MWRFMDEVVEVAWEVMVDTLFPIMDRDFLKGFYLGAGAVTLIVVLAYLFG